MNPATELLKHINVGTGPLGYVVTLEPSMTPGKARQEISVTPEQVKAKFRREGRTFSSFARQHGFPPQEVYRVLNGQSKANFGQAHQIAVALGMKEPSASNEPIAA